MISFVNFNDLLESIKTIPVNNVQQLIYRIAAFDLFHLCYHYQQTSMKNEKN